MSEEAQGPSALESGPGMDPSSLLVIVVGAHLRAEQADRPLAYALLNQVQAWVQQHKASLNVPVTPVVCSDIWYLNQPTLHRRPTISLGGPGVNALSAYYFRKLQPAWVRDDQIMIQLDPEFADLRVCVWGRDHAMTIQAVEMFVQRFLGGYLQAVVTQVEPQGG